MSYLVGKKGGQALSKTMFKATDGQTSVTFVDGINVLFVLVYRNGVMLYSDDYNITSDTITFTTPLSSDDEIVIIK